MTGTDLLRASRDGDQFHYHWAARESLRLLSPGTDLAAIAVEGVSPQDTTGNDGEDVIDIAEYYGSARLSDASRVVYRQLKHSTVRTDIEWTVSELDKTIKGFAKKYRLIKSEQPGTESKARFDIVSNRPVGDAVLQAIAALASRTPRPDLAHQIRYLRQYAAFTDDPAGRTAEADFFHRLHVDQASPGLLSLEGLFRFEVSSVLPGAPDVEHVLLKEMVARRATSLEPDRVIVRSTVLTALRTTEDRLLPSPNLIAPAAHLIPTDNSRSALGEAISTTGRPMIVHASGGVGKSVLTTQIRHSLPPGSIALVYDCFGNGDYRRPTAPRHGHQQGLVQLANELAAHGLCDPLIPAPAQPADYFRAFTARIRAACDALTARAPGALLAVVIDAADNAVLCARDTGERSFVTGLLRETFSDTVRLIMLCRTERIDLLEPPARTKRIELAGFTEAESGQHLRAVFGSASDEQAGEFHRRTGGNPRVQTLALASASDIDGCLASLGEARERDTSVLDGLLQGLVNDCKDAHHGDGDKIDRICQALAALRPRIPIAVLSKLCSVSPALVHSFAADLGHPLLVDGQTLQFRDEPTETWFHDRFRPTGAALTEFIDRLLPLAAGEPYAAACLPQLLWDAGQVDTLVDLALTDGALPRGNDLEQQEIARQRAQFAMKAALRAGRDFEAARLALKAGSLTAGHTRRLELLRDNTDLAGRFLDARTIEDIVATRSLSGHYPGSNLPYEGALLSAADGQGGFARSRLRSGADWLHAWTRHPHDEDPKHRVQVADIAEIGLGLLNTDGPQACAHYLAGWRPRPVAYDAGLIIATRLADAGRIEELEQLGRAARNVKHLQFAVASAAWHANIVGALPLVRPLVRMLKRQRKPIRFGPRNAVTTGHAELPAVAWIVAMGLRHDLLTTAQAERVLRLALPPSLGYDAGSSHGRSPNDLLCGFALLTKIQGRALDPDQIAGFDIAQAQTRRQHTHSRELADHERNIVPLAAWATLWVDCLVGTEANPDTRFSALAGSGLPSHTSFETPWVLMRGVARLSSRVLCFTSTSQPVECMAEWFAAVAPNLAVEVLIDAVRATSATPGLAQLTLALSQSAASRLELMQEDAHYRASQMTALTRAVYRFDPDESLSYFNDAIELTNRVGDDASAIWHTLLTLARAVGSGAAADDRRAYRLGQLIEGLAPYVGDNADKAAAIAAAGALSPSSALALASRWCERRFVDRQDAAQALIEHGDDLADGDWLAPLAMLPFTSGHEAPDLLARAFQEAPGQGGATAQAIGHFTRRIRFRPEAFERVDHAAQQAGIDLQRTLWAPNLRQIDPETSYSHPSNTATAGDESQTTGTSATPPRDPLAECDYTTVDGWNAAHELVRGSHHQLRLEQAIDHAVSLPLPRLGTMLAAFRQVPHFGVFTQDTMIRRLAEHGNLTRAAHREIGKLADTIAGRFCRELTTKSYNPLDLAVLCELAEPRGADLMGTALAELGRQTVPIAADECYYLAGRLARRLPHDQAQAVFDDLAARLEDLVPLDAGDGVFEQQPVADPKTIAALAGYLWSALADPEQSTRWRAAHCVRLLAELGDSEVLEALYGFAFGAIDKAPFVDARLPFYELHARQWLLFALARASQELGSHTRLAVFTPLLRAVLFEHDPHVVMQHSARTVLERLATTGNAELTPQEQEAIGRVNIPTRIVRETWQEQAHARAASRTSRLTDTSHDDATGTPNEQTETFRFFMDYASSWCWPLAEAFALSEEQVERLAARVITDSWGLPVRGDIIEDPRHALDLYPRESTYPYKDNWPAAEDYSFYLAVHALWTVAGSLVRTDTVHWDEDDLVDPFTRWLGRFLISRRDGRWLADRRDPAPLPETDSTRARTGPSRTRTVPDGYFTERLLGDDGWVTVWEHSSNSDYRSTQTVEIRSALASPETARALLIALQTAPSVWPLPLPAADDDDGPIGRGRFDLAGWVNSGDSPEGQDRHDPLAGEIPFPPAHPCDRIADLLELKTDHDMRLWTHEGQTVLRSTVWDETRKTGYRETGERGERLQMRREAVTAMLTTTERSLLVQVAIGRTDDEPDASTPSTGSEDDDDSLPEFGPPFKAYLFDAGGWCSEL